jgi:trans-o-hydroxybenzylidenepyruvate hydratase-aldolase
MAVGTRLSVGDIKGAWAIMPTPATSTASDWRAQDTVDLDESARVVGALIDAGIDGILTLGTLGECGALSWAEKRSFMTTVAETARGRIPVFGGTTSLSTRDCVIQMREARDLGLDGTMCGPSMWNKPDVATAVQFYRDIAEAVPELAICIYANPFVFKFDFPTPFWGQVAAIPQVVSAKVAGYASLLRDLKASGGKIRFMPIDSEFYGAVRLAPEESCAFWSSGASCGPAPVIALRNMVEEARRSADWSRVAALSDEMASATLPIICYGNMTMFQEHNVSLEKGRMAAAGWMKPGPNRPPYQLAPDQVREYARIGGEAWAKLQRQYGA